MKNDKDYVTIRQAEKTGVFREFAKTVGLEVCSVKMSDLTTFGVGGTATNAVFPTTDSQIDKIIGFANENEIPFFALGRGSNVLASDKGYDGILIVLRNNFGQIDFDGNVIRAQAGARTAHIARLAREKSLGGAEFFALLPATVGGAVKMNAGCFGFSTEKLVTRVFATDGNGVCEYSREKCGFGYRKSIFGNKNIVTGAVFELDCGDEQNIVALTDALRAKKAFQPLGERTAGSVFLNVDEPAAKLIEQCGLKGFCLGGAMVSAKHANFIVNKGKATQSDIFNLINIIKNVVFEKTGTMLNSEIEFLGEMS